MARPISNSCGPVWDTYNLYRFGIEAGFSFELHRDETFVPTAEVVIYTHLRDEIRTDSVGNR